MTLGTTANNKTRRDPKNTRRKRWHGHLWCAGGSLLRLASRTTRNAAHVVPESATSCPTAGEKKKNRSVAISLAP